MQSISNICSSVYRRFYPTTKSAPAPGGLTRQIDTMARAERHGSPVLAEVVDVEIDEATYSDARPYNFDVEELSQLLSKLVGDLARESAREATSNQANGDQLSTGYIFAQVFEALGSDLLAGKVDATLKVLVLTCLEHLCSSLDSRDARAELLERGLRELQQFFLAMKRSFDVLDAAHPAGISDEQLMEIAQNSGYGHPAFDFPGNWDAKRDLRNKAKVIVDTLLPKFKMALSQEIAEGGRDAARGYLPILQTLLESSLFQSRAHQALIEVCELGLQALVEKLSEKEFWSSTINSGLDQCQEELNAYHAAKLRLEEGDQGVQKAAGAAREDLRARQLARSCAETSSSFFRFIPLLQNIRSFLDRTLQPVTRLGQAWSEKFVAESLESSLCYYLDIPTSEWSAQLIESLTAQLKNGQTSPIAKDPIKIHVSKVAKKTLSVIAFSPLYWCVGLCNRATARLNRMAARVDLWGTSPRFSALILRTTKYLADGALRIGQFAVNLPPFAWGRRCWAYLVDSTLGWVTAPFALLVGNQVETRLDYLAKSSLRKIFVYRLLDILLEDLHLQEGASAPPNLEVGASSEEN